MRRRVPLINNSIMKSLSSRGSARISSLEECVENFGGASKCNGNQLRASCRGFFVCHAHNCMLNAIKLSVAATPPHCSTHTHTRTHACHAQIIYVCTHWLALLALPSLSVCVCVREVCAKHVEQNAKVVKTFAAISS